MKKKIKVISAVFASVLAVLTFVSPTVYNNNLTKVSPVEIAYGFVPLSWEVTGELHWPDEAELKAAGQWLVDEVFVRDGDIVSEGDLLFTLDVRDNEIQAMSRGAELIRLQNALAGLLESAGEPENAEVKAPFDGLFIKDEAVKAGQRLEKGTGLGRFVNDGAFRITIPFSVGYKEQIKAGMTAEVSMPEWMTTLSGIVESVSKTETNLDGAKVFSASVLIENPGALTENDTAYVTVTDANGERMPAAGTGRLSFERGEALTAPIGGVVADVVPDNSRHGKGGTLVYLRRETQDDYDRDYEELTAQIAVVKKQIERYEYPPDGNIYAGSGGVVSGLVVKSGTTLYEGDVFMSLLPVEKPYLEFELPNEKDTPMVFGGKTLPQVRAVVEVVGQDGSYARVTVGGRVTSGRLRGGKWECRAELDNFEGRPAAGQDVLTLVTYQGDIQSVVVPAQCIFDVGFNQLVVYVIDTRSGLFGEESYLREVSVRVLYGNGELVSLSEDSLYAGMKVVRSPSGQIADGDVVWVREW